MGCSNRWTDLVNFLLSENCCNTVLRQQDIAQIHQASCRRRWVRKLSWCLDDCSVKYLSSPLQFAVCEESKPQVLRHLRPLGWHCSWVTWTAGRFLIPGAQAVSALPLAVPRCPPCPPPRQGASLWTDGEKRRSVTVLQVSQTLSTDEMLNDGWYFRNSALSLGPKTKLLLVREENKILKYSTLYLKQFLAHISFYPQDSYVKKAGRASPSSSQMKLLM